MKDSEKTPNIEPEEDSESEEENPQCECGHGKGHHMVSPIPTYTMWGSFWINLMGVSSVPIRIDFQCRVCKDRFAFTTNREELKKYM